MKKYIVKDTYHSNYYGILWIQREKPLPYVNNDYYLSIRVTK